MVNGEPTELVRDLNATGMRRALFTIHFRSCRIETLTVNNSLFAIDH